MDYDFSISIYSLICSFWHLVLYYYRSLQIDLKTLALTETAAVSQNEPCKLVPSFSLMINMGLRTQGSLGVGASFKLPQTIGSNYLN